MCQSASELDSTCTQGWECSGAERARDMAAPAGRNLLSSSAPAITLHPNRCILALTVTATNPLHTPSKYLIGMVPLGAILRGACRRATQLLDVTRKAHRNCLEVQPEQHCSHHQRCHLPRAFPRSADIHRRRKLSTTQVYADWGSNTRQGMTLLDRGSLAIGDDWRTLNSTGESNAIAPTLIVACPNCGAPHALCLC